jgi:hypothetical protein
MQMFFFSGRITLMLIIQLYMAGWKDQLRGVLRNDERRDAAANEAQVAFLLPCRQVVPLATFFPLFCSWISAMDVAFAFCISGFVRGAIPVAFKILL